MSYQYARVATSRTTGDATGEIKRMSVEHITGYAFAAKGGSNYYVVVDSKYRNQPAAANGPMELVLAALGSCTASDVVEILLKKPFRIDRFVVQLSGERVGASFACVQEDPPALSGLW